MHFEAKHGGKTSKTLTIYHNRVVKLNFLCIFYTKKDELVLHNLLNCKTRISNSKNTYKLSLKGY